MSDTTKAISEAADRRRDGAVDFLRDLIAASREGEAAIQARVADATRALGCEVESIAYRPGEVPMIEEFAGPEALAAGERSSIVARFRGTGGGRSVIFFAHPDGEQVTGTERWRHDPFAGTIDNGRIYGWGVADDLAGVAGFVQALDAVRAAGFVPAGDVILASTPSKRHARGVSALLHGGLTADAAVYMHPAESGVGMREIKALASGQLLFRVTVPGRLPDTTEPGHGAFAHLAVNPIDKAWLICRALQELDADRGRRIHHPALEAAVGRSTNVMISHVAYGRPQALGRISAECVIGGSLAFPPPETLSAVQAELTAAIAAAAARDPWLADHPPRVEWVSGVTGAEVSAEHPLFVATAGAILAVTGETAHVNPLHTSSDIRNPMVQKGIPTVGLGPLCGDLSQNGSHDEWVDVEDYLRSVKVGAGIIANWCGPLRPRR
jgi:acetylornithine deacetylase